MRKTAAFLLLCSSLLCLTGCNNVDDNQTATGQNSVTVTLAPTNKVEEVPDITPELEEPDDEQTPELNASSNGVVSEEVLLNCLEMDYGYVVVKSVYDDFDNNGEYEMFAFVAEPEYMELYDSLYGKVVFLNTRLQLSELTMDFYIWDDSSIRTIALENRLLFVVDEAFVSETASKVYAVYEEEPSCLLSGMGYFSELNGRLVLNVSDYDMIMEYDGFSTGHTWKNYYFYYDEENRCFQEYTATEITKEDYLSWQGADQILLDIETEYPGAELQFLLRENDMVHVNVASDQNGYIVQKNFTSEIVDGALINTEENDGKYQLRCTYAEADGLEQ